MSLKIDLLKALIVPFLEEIGRETAQAISKKVLKKEEKKEEKEEEDD